MAHPALKEWKKTRRSGTLLVASSFYEAIAREITDGEKPEDAAEGDLYFTTPSGIDIGGEVKGGGNNNSFRIKWDQLLRHKIRAQEFPYNGHFLYFFFSYANRQTRRSKGQATHRNLIRESVESGNGNEFLASHTRNLWIVPLPLIEWLRGDDQLTLSFPAQQEEASGRAFHLGRRPLCELARQDRNLLPTPWNVREGHASIPLSLLDGQQNLEALSVSFPVTYFRDHLMPEIDFRHVQWQI